MSRVGALLRRVLLWQGALVALLLVALYLACFPPCYLYTTPISQYRPYPKLPRWHVQELYHSPVTRSRLFDQHQDPMQDWGQPQAHWMYRAGEWITTWLAVSLPAKLVPPPLHLVHLMQGPGQLQVLRTLTLLGVPDVLANRVLSLQDLHAALLEQARTPKREAMLRAGMMPESFVDGALPDFSTLPLGKLERLMSYAISMGYFDEVSYWGSHIYVHNAQSVVLRSDHPNNLNHLLFHFSNEAYLAWHHLPLAVLQPEDDSVAGLFEGDLFASSVPGAVTGVDAQFAGQYGTQSSIKVKEEYEQRKEAAIQAIKKKLATAPADGPAPSGKHVQTAWEAAHGSELWSFFRARPALERNFAGAMSQIDVVVNKALVADYAWDTMEVNGTSTRSLPVDAVVDVGGAEGSFLAAVLAAFPAVPRGVLFDLEGNIAAARKLWDKSGSVATGSTFAPLAQKHDVSLVAGDFFRASTIPLPSSRSAATKYVLRQILHDWSDGDALRILHNLRTRLRGYDNVAVIIVEVNKHTPDFSPNRHWVDFQMLVCCNAKERTAAQWDVLVRASGWRLVERRDTRSMFAIMEIRPDTDAEEEHSKEGRTQGEKGTSDTNKQHREQRKEEL